MGERRESSVARRFYVAALVWEVTYRGNDYGMAEGNGIKIGFGRVEGFPPTQWLDEAGPAPNASTSTCKRTTSTGRPCGCAREPANLTSNPTPTAGRCCPIPPAYRFA